MKASSHVKFCPYVEKHDYEIVIIITKLFDLNPLSAFQQCKNASLDTCIFEKSCFGQIEQSDSHCIIWNNRKSMQNECGQWYIYQFVLLTNCFQKIIAVPNSEKFHENGPN